MIVALVAPAITTISLLSVSPVFAAGYDIVVRAGENAYANDINPPPPWVKYTAGSYPPLMVAKQVGSGAVVAGGFGHTLRNGRWNDSDIPKAYRNFDSLLDKAFQWMVSGATDVLWYEGYDVYNDTVLCEELVNALQDNYGYTITGDDTEPITTTLLNPYDILVIPQLELGMVPGGIPEDLPDADVNNIVTWVNAGGGVFIVDGADTFGHNYCKVQNKILRALVPDLDMMFIQSDELRDPTYNWSGQEWEMYVDVDNTTAIGLAYQNSEGTTRVGVYMPCTLAERDNYEVGLRVSPSVPIYQEGFPGGTLKYDIEAWASGWLADNIQLAVTDTAVPSWNPTLDNNLLKNIQPDNFKSATLTVNIPSSALFGTQNTITITGTSQGDPTKSTKENCRAVVAARVGPPKVDAWVSAQQPNNTFGGSIVNWVGSTDDFYMSGLEPHWNMRTWMRFDLRGIPAVIPPGNWNSGNLVARLYAFCWGIHGTWGMDVECWGSDTDDWGEMEINWNNQPGINYALDNTKITSNDGWHSWNITSFIRSELASGENLATFCLKAPIESAPYPDNFACEFYSKEERDESTHLPFIAIGYDVNTWITPTYAEAMPGGTISYTVKIMNMGSLADNYDLTVSDDAIPGWGLSIPSKALDVQPNELRRVDLDVQISSGVSPCTIDDNVTVTVKSEHYPDNANDSDTCIAHPSEKRIMPAKDDSSTRGEGVIPLENSVWGQGDHETRHVDNTMWIGRESVFAGPDYHYDVGPARGWMKFDLRGISSLENENRVTLNLYVPKRFSATVASVENGGALVGICSVSDDSWTEDTITWGNEPSIGNVLDIRNVSADGRWYSWDVTDFVEAQYQGDNVASFCLVDLGENLDPPHFVHFDGKEYELENQWPYLEILCEEQLPNREVRVYTEPVTQSGPSSGSVENYLVTVVNKGTLADTYTLENMDYLGWMLSLDDTSLVVPAGENRQTILHVTVPSGAVGVLDNITVTATGTGVSDSTKCFAYRGKAELEGLGVTGIICGGLYHAEVDMNFLADGFNQQLVIKFYDYMNSFESENVWWSGGVDLLQMSDAIGHPPQGSLVPKAVKKAELVLRSGGTDRILDSYTVHRGDLRSRYIEILVLWFQHPALRNCFRTELINIMILWFSAPS